ncbi:MAG: hypothetical protein Q7R64_01505 [bacterium]|nr:hypothetical protein [bacterium]
MKSIKLLFSLTIALLAFVGSVNASTLKDGVILYSPGSYLAGQPIPLGVDSYGYNYQAHSFNGSYFNSYANSAGFPPYDGDDATYLAANPTAISHWAWPYRNDQLAMKWNEAWLSNQDQNNDGKLDRHYGFPSYIGSGALLTNHQSGEYGVEEFNWNYFVKIVAAPSDATLAGGFWLNSGGKEIGPEIWGEFAIIQEVLNDQGTGDHGIGYRSPAGPGVGKY